MGKNGQLERDVRFRLKLYIFKYTEMDFLSDLWHFIKARKKWWLAPVIMLLILIGALLVLGGSSAIAPFIYTLF